MLRIILATALLFFSLEAAQFVVIANKESKIGKRLDANEIRRIYLKKRRYIDSLKLIPLNLSASDPLRHSFQKELLYMSERQLASYWAKQHYLGHRPPLTMMSVESVVAFVREVNGAIGYVPKEAVDASVKIIYEYKEEQ
jgi:ABC-type phosphate transport system substrate-binding protein